MANEEVGRHRTQPVRIIHMSVAPADPRPSVGALVIVAKLAGPDQEELQWWMEQLRDRVKVRSWVGSPGRLTSVQVDAPEDRFQFEAVARRLITAVDEANAAYPERYVAWRREHDARMAEEWPRKEQRFADHQAILDRVMDEYRSNLQIESE